MKGFLLVRYLSNTSHKQKMINTCTSRKQKKDQHTIGVSTRSNIKREHNYISLLHTIVITLIATSICRVL